MEDIIKFTSVLILALAWFFAVWSTVYWIDDRFGLDMPFYVKIVVYFCLARGLSFKREEWNH